MTESRNDTRRPAFQWYPGDARRDTALQSCPLVVRGLWREMLDLMHFGEPYGHLTSGGVPITIEELARMVGEPAAKVRRWVAELEAKKVLSRTEAGVIYSRRMVKDEHIRQVRSAAGHEGGTRSRGRSKDAAPAARGFAQANPEQTTEPPAQQKGPPAVASASASAKEPSVVVFETAIALSAIANRALAESPHEHVRRRHAVPRLIATSASTLEASTAILAADIPLDFAVEAVAEIARTCNPERGVSSLNYFVDGVVRAWERHQAGELAAQTELPPPRPGDRAPGRHAASRTGRRAYAGKPNPGEQNYANAAAALGLADPSSDLEEEPVL